MTQDLFKNYNYLGFHNPSYIDNMGSIEISNDFSNLIAIKRKNSEVQIDKTAVIEILTKDYAFGDRTIVQGINKTPWMAKPNDAKTEWKFSPNIKFKNIELNTLEISKKLFFLLKEEILNYVKGKKNIGILLSGGMDSRMVAGVLDTLIKNNEIKEVKVIAFTWGKKSSRDVVYAKRIADRLKWGWKHFEMTSEDLLANIKETAVRGCEYSPIHLHAMLRVREEKNIDCILAGSYGDSMGRGEYSSKRIIHLYDIRSGIDNNNGLFKKNIIKKHFVEINKDVNAYRKIYPQDKKHQQIEQDYQIHYWRRMLNPCMSVISEKTPLCQLFTSPKLVEFIWSLNPISRNDEVYKELLKLFKTDLMDIPWARTGLKYGEIEGVPDSFEKKHYSYSDMINRDIYDNIKGLVLSNNIERLNIFNMKTLSGIFKLMKTPLYYKDIALESKLIWIASLSMFIDLYKIDLNLIDDGESNLYDTINMFLPLNKNILKKVKQLLR